MGKRSETTEECCRQKPRICLLASIKIFMAESPYFCSFLNLGWVTNCSQARKHTTRKRRNHGLEAAPRPQGAALTQTKTHRAIQPHPCPYSIRRYPSNTYRLSYRHASARCAHGGRVAPRADAGRLKTIQKGPMCANCLKSAPMLGPCRQQNAEPGGNA